ncbi:MAG: hypothetical protein M1823_005127 [Watsoniomyces obsoletus]|nr:MAG: hypothetical protein M1823_005127 [Watsoniomyces obsoletus]
MAANYWASSQYRHWLFSKPQLVEIRTTLENHERPLVQQYPLPELRLLSLFFREQINKLGRRLQLRQQAQATAQIYVRRFYSKVEIRRTNPYLVLTTALYLAGKMEECPQHIRVFLNEARNAWPDFIPTDSSRIGECEFSLISEMNSQLIVHHPYRTLSEVQKSLGLSSDDMGLAWQVINDHYLTDLPLLYAPHIIAIAAIFLTVALKPSPSSSNTTVPRIRTGQVSTHPTALQRWTTWVAESEVDLDGVVDCTQEMLSLYEIWEQYHERICREQIARFVRSLGMDK